jgi:hypothetical protein
MIGIPPYIRFSPEGERLDTVSSPRPWLPSTPSTPYDPTEGYFPMPDGRVMHVRSDVVGFLMLDPSGGAPPLIAEVAARPVAYLDGERDELQAIADRRAAIPGAAAPRAAVPRHKLPVRAPFVDPHGRIWLQRSATAEKVAPRVAMRSGPDSLMVTYAEPSVYAAFEPDGTFLGEVRLPMGVYPGFAGDFAWLILEDADGVPLLTKFRLAPDA